MTAHAPRPPRAPRTAPTEEALVDAAIDGDEWAWAALCAQHLPQVRALANARLRDAHAAESVVQETFRRAWTRLPQVRDAARFGSWLQAIAANVAVENVQRHRAMAPPAAARDLPAPAVGLVDRWRSRLAGLGDAVPVAVAAPALVVVVIAGVALPALEPAAPVPPDTSVAVAPAAPAPAAPAARTGAVTAPTSPAPGPRAPAPAPPADGSTVASTTTTPSSPTPAPRPAPGTDLGSESTGFGDEASTEHDDAEHDDAADTADDAGNDDDADAGAPAASGPVESLEIHLEELAAPDRQARRTNSRQ